MPPNKKQQRKKKRRQEPSSGSNQATSSQEEETFTGDSIWQKDISSHDTAAAVKEQFDGTSEKPFRHAVLENLFNEQFLEIAKRELLKQDFFDKKNDLYDFKQTDSLTKVETGVLEQLRSGIYSKQFRDFLEQVRELGNGTVIVFNLV